MRWEELFDDLEAQAAAAAAAALAADVADRTRFEQGRQAWQDRLRPAVGARVVVAVLGTTCRGVLREVGPDWLLLEEDPRREVLVPAAAVLGVTGAGAGVVPLEGEVARRLDLRWALRGVVRSRTQVQLVLVDGSTVSGTLDRVGADHVDLAEHPVGEPRRAGAVRSVRFVPLSALAAVRSADP